jgi:hypothetical protein
MTDKEHEEIEDDDDEYEMTFDPDEALILAINEVDDLKDLVEDQKSEIEKLKEDVSFLLKNHKKS